MQNEYKCPLCQSVITIDDVNVATDIALCRACGKTSPFSVVSGASGISIDILDKPPRCVKIEKDFSGGKVITYRKLSGALFFLIPFTAFWSGFSMFGIYGNQIRKGEFDLKLSLFGIPFLIGTIVLLSVITFMIAGKWQITLRNGTGTVFVGVGSLGWTRRFVYNRESLVSLRMTDMKVNEVPQKGVFIRNGNNDMIFGATMTEEAKQFIAATIMKEAKSV